MPFNDKLKLRGNAEGLELWLGEEKITNAIGLTFTVEPGRVIIADVTLRIADVDIDVDDVDIRRTEEPDDGG